MRCLEHERNVRWNTRRMFTRGLCVCARRYVRGCMSLRVLGCVKAKLSGISFLFNILWAYALCLHKPNNLEKPCLSVWGRFVTWLRFESRSSLKGRLSTSVLLDCFPLKTAITAFVVRGCCQLSHWSNGKRAACSYRVIVDNEFTGSTRLLLFRDVTSLWPLEFRSNKDALRGLDRLKGTKTFV